MKDKKKTRVSTVVLLALIWMMAILPFPSNGQEVFSPQTPAQGTALDLKNKGPVLRAGGGTGAGDGINGGGGTENDGHQNDTGVPTTDALYLVLLLSAGYLITMEARRAWRKKN